MVYTRFQPTATKRELADAIMKYCLRHCPEGGRKRKDLCKNHSCPLWPYRVKMPVSPDNTHLFKINSMDPFVTAVIEVAEKMPSTFFFSSVRNTCDATGVAPLNHNWWGLMAKTKDWRKRFRATGIVGKSTTKSCRGGTDREYQKTASLTRQPTEEHHG